MLLLVSDGNHFSCVKKSNTRGEFCLQFHNLFYGFVYWRYQSFFIVCRLSKICVSTAIRLIAKHDINAISFYQYEWLTTFTNSSIRRCIHHFIFTPALSAIGRFWKRGIITSCVDWLYFQSNLMGYLHKS